MKISVKAIPILVRERRILLLKEKQYEGGNNPGLWDCPGGTRLDDESIFDTLSREMNEECGLICPRADTFDMYAFQDVGTIRLYVPIPYWHKPQVVLGPDHSEAEWFRPLPAENDMMPKLKLICTNLLRAMQ